MSKPKKLKFAASSLAVVVGLGSIVACSSQSTDKSTSSPSSSAPAGTSGSKLNIVNGKIDPPVTITTIRGIDPTAKFKNGETWENNVHTKWAKETLGVDIKTLWSAQVGDGSINTKLRLMLSSGEELPDVMSIIDKDTVNMFIDSGKVMSVDEAFEKYAGKEWKSSLVEQPDAWLPFLRGKQKMALPITQTTVTSEPVLWIRKDWMDKLGLQAPKSLADLETIMDAFANKDPDGNGKNDTIPLDFGMKDQFSGYVVGDTSWLFGAFGSIPDQWSKDADGKLAFGSIQPGVKSALAKLKDWKDKGYIPADIALHDWNKIVENVSSGKLGIIAGANWFPQYPGSMVFAKDPKADYEPYAFPAGPDGKKGQSVAVPSLGGIVISKDISQEALEAFFLYMNKLWATSSSDDPFVLKGFQENYDYVIQDGKAILDEDKIPGGRVGAVKYTIPMGIPAPMSKIVDFQKKVATDDPLTPSQIAWANANGTNFNDPMRKIVGKATLLTIEQKGFDIPNLFTGPTTSTQKSRGEFLKKLEMDTFTQILYGKVPVDEFDNFVKKWQSSGGDQITKEVNDWYNSVK
jgi:putative aldouronate transport system substrate-binding protein